MCVSLILPVTVFTLGICMCEGFGQDSGYEHDESHLMHDMKYSILDCIIYMECDWTFS